MFRASYEGLGLLLGKSESRRAYHKKKNGAAVDLKGEGRTEPEIKKDALGHGYWVIPLGMHQKVVGVRLSFVSCGSFIKLCELFSLALIL